MSEFSPISLTAATYTLTRSTHAECDLVANRAAGIACTLPAAKGTGAEFRFVVGTALSGANLVVAALGTDIMQGSAIVAQDSGDTVVHFETAADSDTITMNGTTKGGLKGDRIVLRDVASGLWSVSIIAAATDVEATPFSGT
jgi:hypothetical protein